jgi:hypothetical protein
VLDAQAKSLSTSTRKKPTIRPISASADIRDEARPIAVNVASRQFRSDFALASCFLWYSVFITCQERDKRSPC